MPRTVVHPANLTLAITGASGSLYAAAMLRALHADSRVTHVNLVASESALRVLAEELRLGGRRALVESLLGHPAPKVRLLHDGDIGASIASGSYPADAMVVLPCSMGTLASIAHGLASTLIERAADVTLKEARPLLLCIRETPFNRIHLRNMQLAAEAGATIYPCIPTFYDGPHTMADLAEAFVNRVLSHLGLPQPGAFQWRPDPLPALDPLPEPDQDPDTPSSAHDTKPSTP